MPSPLCTLLSLICFLVWLSCCSSPEGTRHFMFSVPLLKPWSLASHPLVWLLTPTHYVRPARQFCIHETLVNQTLRLNYSWPLQGMPQPYLSLGFIDMIFPPPKQSLFTCTHEYMYMCAHMHAHKCLFPLILLLLQVSCRPSTLRNLPWAMPTAPHMGLLSYHTVHTGLSSFLYHNGTPSRQWLVSSTLGKN